MRNEESVKSAFSKNSPSIELLDYANHNATIQLYDCDDYKIGKLFCDGVEMLCLTCYGEPYSKVDIYNITNPPDELSFIGNSLSEGLLLMVFTSDLVGDEAHESLLPPFNGIKKGYLVCKSFRYFTDTPEIL